MNKEEIRPLKVGDWIYNDFRLPPGRRNWYTNRSPYCKITKVTDKRVYSDDNFLPTEKARIVPADELDKWLQWKYRERLVNDLYDCDFEKLTLDQLKRIKAIVDEEKK